MAMLGNPAKALLKRDALSQKEFYKYQDMLHIINVNKSNLNLSALHVICITTNQSYNGIDKIFSKEFLEELENTLDI